MPTPGMVAMEDMVDMADMVVTVVMVDMDGDGAADPDPGEPD